MLIRALYMIPIFFRVLFAKHLISADLYMKSGNVIKLRFLTSLEYKTKGGQVTELSWVTLGNHRMLQIDIDQIESIVQR